MSKGRNTSVVSIRLPDDVVIGLKAKAVKQNLPLSEYLKLEILKTFPDLDSSDTLAKPSALPATRIGPKQPCPCGAKYPDGNLKQYRHCCGSKYY
jgi:hypothetical protein